MYCSIKFFHGTVIQITCQFYGVSTSPGYIFIFYFPFFFLVLAIFVLYFCSSHTLKLIFS